MQYDNTSVEILIRLGYCLIPLLQLYNSLDKIWFIQVNRFIILFQM